MADPPGARSLQAPDDVRDAVVLAGAHEDVDVIRAEGQGVDHEAELPSGLEEALLANPLDHPVPEDVAPVLGRELQVQVRLADAMVISKPRNILDVGVGKVCYEKHVVTDY